MDLAADLGTPGGQPGSDIAEMTAAAPTPQLVRDRLLRSRSIMSTVVGQHGAAIAADSSNYTIVATPPGPRVSFVDIVGQALAVAPTLGDVATAVLILAGATLDSRAERPLLSSRTREPGVPTR
jgi:hypothetical protein